MATRACIAMPKGKSWVGVYSHWDGYPTGLGDVLWNLLAHRYCFDVQRARQELILDNPEGWSSLGCFHSRSGSLEAVMGWDGKTKLTVDEEARQSVVDGHVVTRTQILPVSYQNDPARGLGVTKPRITPARCLASGIEYVYVLRAEMLEILKVDRSIEPLYCWYYAANKPELLDLAKAA